MVVWERPEPPGRPVLAPLSRERIVRAAIRLADADGLEAVSLRKVAAALDVGPMRLYGYIATKEELLELMLDAVFKKTSAAHDQSKQLSDRVDSLRKEIDEGTKLGIEGAKQLAAASAQAVGAFERQVAALQGIGPLRFLEPKDAEKRPDIKEDVVERLKGLNMLRPLYS